MSLTTKTTVRALTAVILVVAVLGAIAAYRDTKATKILFIGNSLTTANNLPAMVASIAGSHGVEVIHETHAPGGARLLGHASNQNVSRKLRNKSWDFVVLQEQSQLPSFAITVLLAKVFPPARRLVEDARKANPDTSVIFYMTMARRNGDPGMSHVSRELLSYEGTQRRINSSYLRMARDNRASVAPVGEAWLIVRKQRPDIVLYADNIHPNPTGTYLAACVLYAALFKRPCSGAAVPRRVDKSVAAYLQKVADDVVLRSVNKWDWRE